MKLRKPDEPVCEMDMTPMIDCVFQLLIFFMVAASMAKIDKSVDIHLPVAPRPPSPRRRTSAAAAPSTSPPSAPPPPTVPSPRPAPS